MSRRCPECGEAPPWAERPRAEWPQHAPFCSDRCKLVDLSRWMDGDYVVQGPSWAAADPRKRDD